MKVEVQNFRPAWKAAKQDFAHEWMRQSPIWRDADLATHANDILDWRKGFFVSFCAKYGMVPIFEDSRLASTPKIEYVEVNDEQMFAWFLLRWS